MILETAKIFGQTILLYACVVAVFLIIVWLCLTIEKKYKRYKKNKRARQHRQTIRKKQLRKHDADYQSRLLRTIYKIECENIELGNRRINRQTIYINGRLATPSKRAAIMRGVKKNAEKNA